MSPKHLKDGSLLRLHVDVHLHLIGRTVHDGDFLLVDFVLNEIVFDLDVLGLLGTACPPIGLEQDGTHVVLVEQRRIHPPLSYFLLIVVILFFVKEIIVFDKLLPSHLYVCCPAIAVAAVIAIIAVAPQPLHCSPPLPCHKYSQHGRVVRKTLELLEILG